MKAKLRALRAAARRHPPSVLLLWALGAVVIVATALALSDPALVMFALDPELVAVLVLSSIALLRGSPALAFVRARLRLKRLRSSRDT
jgi:hypothetical protein